MDRAVLEDGTAAGRKQPCEKGLGQKGLEGAGGSEPPQPDCSMAAPPPAFVARLITFPLFSRILKF